MIFFTVPEPTANNLAIGSVHSGAKNQMVASFNDAETTIGKPRPKKQYTQ